MQRRLPSPGLQVDVVIPDHDAPIARQGRRKEQQTGVQREQRRRQQLRFPGRALARATGAGQLTLEAQLRLRKARLRFHREARGFDDIVDVVSEVANAYRDLQGSSPTTSTFTQRLKTGG